MDIQSLNTEDFIKYAERQAVGCFFGIVTDQKDEVVEGVPVTINTISKFNRASLLTTVEPEDDYPAGDLSIVRFGRPGSRERVEAYGKWNETNETSVFMEDALE
jgi:hypothetical protein